MGRLEEATLHCQVVVVVVVVVVVKLMASKEEAVGGRQDDDDDDDDGGWLSLFVSLCVCIYLQEMVSFMRMAYPYYYHPSLGLQLATLGELLQLTTTTTTTTSSSSSADEEEGDGHHPSLLLRGGGGGGSDVYEEALRILSVTHGEQHEMVHSLIEAINTT